MIQLLMATVCCMVVSFLICGIPSGLIIAKLTTGADVRELGSGNIGMTNVARTVGSKAATATLFFDTLKALVCSLGSRFVITQLCFAGDWAMLAPQSSFAWASGFIYMACICGHMFSPYLGFKGGKSIAVGFGGSFGLSWQLPLGLLAVFFAFVIPSKKVSLGSVVSAASAPIWALILGFSPTIMPAMVVVAILVVWAHRENIKKLLGGTESDFSVHHEGNEPAPRSEER